MNAPYYVLGVKLLVPTSSWRCSDSQENARPSCALHFAQCTGLLTLQLHLCMQLYDGFYVTPRRPAPSAHTRSNRARVVTSRLAGLPPKSSRLRGASYDRIYEIATVFPILFVEISLLFIEHYP